MNKRIAGISLRYSIILILSLSYSLLSRILAPLTAYLSYALIGLFYSATLSSNVIYFSGKEVELIDACICVLAYLLILALNLSVEMPLKKRIKSLSFSLSLFLAFNVLRILLLSLVFAQGYSFFSALHAFFWYFGSIIAVFLIWLISVRVFKIEKIPFVSDMAYLIKKIK